MVESKHAAHLHILAVANTLLRTRRSDRLRILDIGCGDARLMSYLHDALSNQFRGSVIEVHGFDVSDQGHHDRELIDGAQRRLQSKFPTVDWNSRLKTWAANSDWDYPAEYFDLAVSNQVLEHVSDLDHFLKNLKRALRPGGTSVHLFPLGNHIFEAHTRMPFVHYVRDFEDRIAYASLLNRVGLSRFGRDRQILGYDDARVHAVDACRFVQSTTFYRKFDEFYRLCNQHQLSLSHKFTRDFYRTKLRQLLRLQRLGCYSQRRLHFANWFFFFFLKYVSSVTFTMESIDYDIGHRIRQEKLHQGEREVASDLKAA